MTKILTDFLTLAEKATPGPWWIGERQPNSYETMIHPDYRRDEIISSLTLDNRKIFSVRNADAQLRASFDFIAQSRTLAPAMAKALLVAVEALEQVKNNIGFGGRENMEAGLARCSAALTEIETILKECK